MATVRDMIIVFSVIISVYILIKLFIWFMSPYIIDRDDPQPRLKSYMFTDPKTTQSFKFPTIKDKATKSISLIFPAYNEEKRLRPCLDPTIKYLIDRENNDKNKNKGGSNGTSSKPFTWEIIVVSDGSKDKTCDIVQEYAAKYTTDKGMLHARGCLILFADADGASEITHLSRLEGAIMKELSVNNHWDCLEKDCIAIGSRAHLQAKAEAERTIFRNFLMWGFHFVVKYVGDVHDIKDTQCGFKLFTRDAVRKTVAYQRIRRWCFDPEQLMLAQKQGIPIKEQQIAWQEIDGSKIQPIKASLNMAREMVLMRACYIFGVWYTITLSDSQSRQWYTTTQMPILGPTYIFVRQPLTWNDAELYCQTVYGTHLASIHTISQQIEAKSLCEDSTDTTFGIDDCYIGLNDLSNEGEWTWSDGSPYNMSINDFHPGEPNSHLGVEEDCVEMSGTSLNYQWNDCPCTDQSYFLCNRYSRSPSLSPTPPSNEPTINPTSDPTAEPSRQPSVYPTITPSMTPTVRVRDGGVVATTSNEIPATTIIYLTQQSNSLFNFESITATQLIIGILIIMTCFIGPLSIGMCVCCCLYKKRESLKKTTTETISEIREHKKSGHREPGDPNGNDTSKLGMSATDSLKLQPGTSENYSFTPSGPKLVVIDANVPSQINSKPVMANIGSDNSEAIYENVEHEYDTNNVESRGKILGTDGQKGLELQKLSTNDNNKMNEILECVINQPSIKSQTPMMDGRSGLKLHKHIDSIKSDNSEILYQNNHPRTSGDGIGDTSKGDRVNNEPTPMIDIERV